MLLFIFRIYRTLRRAIAGRRYPSQLAWAIALGLMLGFVPHGNLVALTLLLVILCLNINHAAMGLTALAASFFAWRLDPYSHQVGQFVLQKESVANFANRAWQWPLVPWTDLNNTIVTGSLLIGLASLLPVFTILYPLCRMIVPKPKKETVDQEADSTQPTAEVLHAPAASRSADTSTTVEAAVQQLARAIQGASTSQGVPRASTVLPTSRPIDFQEIDSSDPRDTTTHTVHAAHARPVPTSTSVRTRMDVIRIQSDSPTTESGRSTPPLNNTVAVDEALNYLLRQLRESNQGDAA